MTDQPSPVQQIAAGLERDDVGGSDRAHRRARRSGADFRTDEGLERLLSLRDGRDPSWSDIGPDWQLRVAIYEQQKHNAATNGDAA